MIEQLISTFVVTSKAEFQLKCIVDILESLHTQLKDFSAGDFDRYIDSHNDLEERFGDGNAVPFDPYESLRHQLQTSGMYDLPDKINRFSDLLFFANNTARRHQVMNEFFEIFFPTLETHYLCKDDDGNEIMVPKSKMPAQQLSEINFRKEVRETEEAIENEFCLAPYDDWLAAITNMVSDRRPFTEMLTLFKP